jgi:hypothetical protein
MSKQDRNKINQKRSLKQRINKLNRKTNKIDEEIETLKQLEKLYEEL